jgi:2-C-methyl-D-erythritol 2,4-cyclodiphosphate synthase
MTEVRVGLGHDIHGFSSGRDLILGGVKVPNDRGLKGHSDADALLHAIMDALLGAAGLSDIGELFPDTDPAYRGADSAKLLARVVEKIHALGYSVGNIDTVVHCEKPRLGPLKAIMRENIAGILQIPVDRVTVKAGTNEGFDAVGRGEAIVCQAVVLLTRET